MQPVSGADSRLPVLPVINETTQPSEATKYLPVAEAQPAQAVKSRTEPLANTNPSQRRYYVIENDSDRQSLLQAFRHEYRRKGEATQGKQVFYISSPDDLDKHGLIRQVNPESGTDRVTPGRIFQDKPLLLVLDFTQMQPEAGDIALLNELIDTPSKFNGQRLGRQIRVSILMDRATMQLLGPDSWRRIKRFDYCSEADYAQHRCSDNNAFLNKAVDSAPDVLLADPSVKKVAFYDDKHWENRLFGRFQISPGGQFLFEPGILSELSSGESLILQDAPWHNTRFQNALCDTLREGGYEAPNGEWFPISDNLRLFKTEYSQSQLQRDKAAHPFTEFNPEQSFVVLDQENFTYLTKRNYINSEGMLISFNPLAELCRGCQQLCIKGEPSLKQWCLLWELLANIPQEQVPELVQLSSPGILAWIQSQTLNLSILTRDDISDDSVSFCERTSSSDSDDSDMDIDPPDVTYTLSDADTWDGLFEQIEIASASESRFTRKSSPLLKAIKAGKNVHIRGIKQDSQWLNHWQTLQNSPAFLLVNGKKILVPEASVTLWVESDLANTSYQSPEPGMYSECITQCKMLLDRAIETIMDHPKISRQFLKFEESLRTNHELLHYFKKNIKFFSCLFLLNGYLKELTRSQGNNYPWNISFKRLLSACFHFEAQCQFLSADHHQEQLNINILREAMLPLLLHSGCRGDENLYGFIKVTLRFLIYLPLSSFPFDHRNYTFTKLGCAIKCTNDSANYSGLALWMKKTDFDRNRLKAVFWSLAPSFPAELLFKEHLYSAPSEQLLTECANYLVGAESNPEKARVLAKKLGVNITDSKGLKYFHNDVKNQIENYTHFLAYILRHYYRNTHGFGCLATRICEKYNPGHDSVAITDEGYQPFIEHFEAMVSKAFGARPDKSSASELQGEKAFRRLLAHAIFTGQPSTVFQHSRPVRLMLAGLALEPALMVGLPVASQYHAQMLINALYFYRCDIKNKTYILDDYSLTELYLDDQAPREVLYGKQTFTDPGQNSSHWVDGPLMAWAKNTQPSLLVLHGVDRASRALLQPLAGLQQSPPQLCYGGQSITLTDRHKVVMTCDIDQLNSISLASIFPETVLSIPCEPEDPQYLALAILLPKLDGPFFHYGQYTSACLLSLFNQYKPLCPDTMLCGRDLEDALAFMHLMVGYAQQPVSSLELTKHQLHALVIEAMSLSLDGMVAPECLEELNTLKTTFGQQFPCDRSILQSVDDVFAEFSHQLKRANPDIDLATASVSRLVRQYWLSLEKGRQGKAVTLVEGSAGWGKDLIISRVLALWLEQNNKSKTEYHHINASRSQWPEILKINEQAMNTGKVLIISELNIIPPEQLESLFRYIDRTHKNSGYQLIATVNPPSGFPCREELTRYSKSISRRVTLNPLSKEEIRSVIQRTRHRLALNHPEVEWHLQTGYLDDWLASHFHTLTQLLQQSELSILPGMADLMVAIRAFAHQPSERWPEIFSRQFALEMELLALTMTDLTRQAHLATTIQFGHSDKEHQIEVSPITDSERERLLVSQSGLPEYLVIPEKYPLLERKHLVVDLFEGGEKEGRSKLAATAPNLWATKGVVGTINSAQSSRPIDGNVNAFSNLYSQKWFDTDDFKPEEYRLRLKQLEFVSDRIESKSIDPTSAGVTLINRLHQVQGIEHSQKNGIKGSYQAKVSHDWLALAGLSPQDKLLSLRSKPEVSLDIARSHATGQLLIRLNPKEHKKSMLLKLVFY